MTIRYRQPTALRRHPLSLALWAAALCLPASLALAQQAGDQASSGETAKQLDTIVVTAQKREQQIQDVPIAINAYTGDFLEKNGLDNYQDIGALVPGLEIQMQSVANPSLSIRGITADLDDPTQEPRISVFQDGVSMSRSRGSFATPFDMQRVEVLRGPQGTLFGRAAEIGALHFIENKARDGTSSAFELGVGNFSERKFTGFVNGTLGEGVYGRVAAYYENRDGYVDNLSGGSLQGNETRALRGGLHFNFGETNAFDLILNYEKDTPPGTAFRSMVIPNRRFSFDPYRADSQRGDGLGTDRELDSVTGLGYFRLNDNWTLSSTTGWRHFDSLDKFDSDGSQVDLIEFNEDANGRQFSQEFRFNYDNGGNFTGFAGLSFTSETSKRDLRYQGDERSLYALFSPIINAGAIQQLVGLGFDLATATATANALYPVIPLLNPDGSPNVSMTSLPLLTPGGPVFLPLNPDHRETFGNDVDVRSTEIFADGTWRMGDRWELTLGLRGTHESATYGYFADAGNGSTLGYLLSGRFPAPACLPNTVCTNLLFPATGGRLKGDGRWTSAVGRAVLRYEFNDNLSMYGSISRGRRPAMILVNDLGKSEIPAEIVTSYEIGLKGSTSGGGLAYDLSAYYYDYSNFQAQIQNPTPPPFLIDANGGRAHASGFEASLYARFSDRVTGYFNLGLTDGGFNAVDENGNPQALAGNTFRLMPKQSLAMGLDWTVPLSGDREFFFRPNITWQSKVYFQDENNPSAFGQSFAGKIQQSAYGLVNLRTGMNFGREWSLTLSIDNALDKKYLIDAGNTGLTFGIPTLIPGAPRTFGLSVNGRF